MKIVHFCAGLEGNNGMANTARQFAGEESARGDESEVTSELGKIAPGADEVMIHGAWLPVLWKAAKRAKAVGARLVIRPAGSYDPVRLRFHGWRKRLVGFWERRMLRRADAVLATCEQERAWILAYEPRVKKVEVTDLKRFFKLQVPGSTSKVSGLTSLNGGETRRGHVLYLGRRHPLKGVEFLERAVGEVNAAIDQSNNRALTLRIVSDHFGEALERDWEWCDVLVLPTLSENFGRVVAEALERGKPVITTDGAPAWGEGESEKEEGIVEKYGGRLIYLKGYRDGSDEDRVELLKSALSRFVMGKRCVSKSERRNLIGDRRALDGGIGIWYDSTDVVKLSVRL